jgi:hypothetical protein
MDVVRTFTVLPSMPGSVGLSLIFSRIQGTAYTLPGTEVHFYFSYGKKPIESCQPPNRKSIPCRELIAVDSTSSQPHHICPGVRLFHPQLVDSQWCGNKEIINSNQSANICNEQYLCVHLLGCYPSFLWILISEVLTVEELPVRNLLNQSVTSRVGYVKTECKYPVTSDYLANAIIIPYDAWDPSSAYLCKFSRKNVCSVTDVWRDTAKVLFKCIFVHNARVLIFQLLTETECDHAF